MDFFFPLYNFSTPLTRPGPAKQHAGATPRRPRRPVSQPRYVDRPDALGRFAAGLLRCAVPPARHDGTTGLRHSRIDQTPLPETHGRGLAGPVPGCRHGHCRTPARAHALAAMLKVVCVPAPRQSIQIKNEKQTKRLRCALQQQVLVDPAPRPRPRPCPDAAQLDSPPTCRLPCV